MPRRNAGLATASRIVLSLIIAAFIGLAGCERSDGPYDQGYEYGCKMGQTSRNIGGSPNVANAKDAAARCQYLKEKSGTGFKLGSPEYGDYMRGVEDGYFDGYR